MFSQCCSSQGAIAARSSDPWLQHDGNYNLTGFDIGWGAHQGSCIIFGSWKLLSAGVAVKALNCSAPQWIQQAGWVRPSQGEQGCPVLCQRLQPLQQGQHNSGTGCTSASPVHSLPLQHRPPVTKLRWAEAAACIVSCGNPWWRDESRQCWELHPKLLQLGLSDFICQLPWMHDLGRALVIEKD